MKRSPAFILKTLTVSCILHSGLAARAETIPDNPNCVKPTAIHFGHGASAASARGTVVRAEYACYTLGMQAGQTLTVKATSPEDNVVFVAYRPGYSLKQASDGPDITGPTLEGAGDQDEATSLTGKLPQTGQYLFVLGTTRGAGGSYTIRFQVK